MERVFIALFLIFLSELSFAQTTKIGDRLTIDFPSAPEIQQAGNKTIYIINDSSYVINVMVADMRDNLNFNISGDQLTEFYRGIINGTLNAATDSKLISETAVKVGQYDGREIRYTKDFYGIDDIPVTKRILVINKSVYTFDVWDLSKRGQTTLENQVFGSITLQ
jgi:hypothetical protein